MNDRIIALIRTAVPGAVGWLIAQAIAQIPAVSDWITYVDGLLVEANVPGTVETLLTAAAIFLVIAAYYWLVRQLGVWFPTLRPWIERIGLGSSKTPTYPTAGVVTVKLRAEVAEYLAAIEAARTAPDDEPKHRAE